MRVFLNDFVPSLLISEVSWSNPETKELEEKIGE
jgi:hypothetical protein